MQDKHLLKMFKAKEVSNIAQGWKEKTKKNVTKAMHLCKNHTFNKMLFWWGKIIQVGISLRIFQSFYEKYSLTYMDPVQSCTVTFLKQLC